MDRRRFLSQAGKKGSVVMAAAVAGSAAMSDGVREKAQQSLSALNDEIRILRKRVDELDSGYKKSFRALLIVTTITTGIDVITWV